MSKSVNIGVTSTHDDSGLASAKRSLKEVSGGTDQTSIAQRQLQRATAGTNVALIALQRIASGDVVGGIRMSIEALSTKLGNFGVQIAAAGAAFSAGWQVGTWIRDITGLGNALDKLLTPAADTKASITTLANNRLTALRAELDGVRNSLNESAKSAGELISHIDSIAKARLADRQLAQLTAARGASPANAPVIAAIAALDNARISPEQKAGVSSMDNVAREASENRQKIQQDLSNARTELDRATKTYKEKQSQGVRDDSEILKAAIARNTINELTRQLPAALADEEKATDNARNAHTALTLAMIEETKARDALHAAVKKQNDDRAASALGDPAAAQGALNARNAAIPNPDTLESLRARGRAILDEARGNLGPVDDTRRRELAAEFATLKQKAADIQAKAAAAIPGDLPAQAAAQRTIATRAATAAADARARLTDPSIAHAEELAARKQKESDKSFGNLLKRAHHSGYSAITDAAGNITAQRDPHVLGAIGKRLADAVVADAKQKVAEEAQRKAEALDAAAAKATIDSKTLLETIAKNTAAGPIS
jgi:hypothetical protein